MILVLPFVLRSVYISLRNLDHAPGACRRQPRRHAEPRDAVTVTLPLLMPGLLSGWLFAAILSFNEFTASLFVTGAAHADAAGRPCTTTCANTRTRPWRRSSGHLHRRDRNAC